MPFVPFPNCALYEIRMLWDQQEVENTIWVEHDAAPDGAAIATMATAIRTWFAGSVLDDLSNTVQLVEVVGTAKNTPGGASGTAVASAGTVGGVVSPSMPNNVALCVSFRTGLAGRWNRGRNYVPGMTEDGVTANTFLSARVANIVTAYNSLIGVVADNGGTWVVASRILAGVERAVGQTTPVTAALATDLYVDSQRRRLPGRGR